MGSGIIQRLRAAGLVLALAAITFKAFLPPGFMFSDHDGRMAIVLCSADGARISFNPLTDAVNDDHAPQSDSAGQHCPFAVAGAATITPVVAAVAEAPLAHAIDAAATPRAARPQLTQAGPPLPARGPPLTA